MHSAQIHSYIYKSPKFCIKTRSSLLLSRGWSDNHATYSAFPASKTTNKKEIKRNNINF